MNTLIQIQPKSSKDKAPSEKLKLGEKLTEKNIIEKELYNSLSDSKGPMREMCSHIIEAGGKKIRPLLTVYWGQVFGGINPDLLNAAVATELIHMASLIHDDIIDNSSLRRSRPSINSLWGTHSAVLCGDYLFAKAFRILSGNRLLQSLDYMVEAIESMCSGEVMQAAARFNTGLSVRDYYSLIAMKTGIFIGCCCKSGAAVAGATDIQLKLAYNYGLNLGYAYQIVDDILDYYGETETMGKPRYEDLKQGGITLPVIFLLKNGLYCKELRELIESREFTEGNLAGLTEVMEQAGIREKCMNIAGLHIAKAKRFAAMFPENEYSRKLVNLADKLCTRVF